jgi:hypothetical protein
MKFIASYNWCKILYDNTREADHKWKVAQRPEPIKEQCQRAHVRMRRGRSRDPKFIPIKKRERPREKNPHRSDFGWWTNVVDLQPLRMDF